VSRTISVTDAVAAFGSLQAWYMNKPELDRFDLVLVEDLIKLGIVVPVEEAPAAPARELPAVPAAPRSDAIYACNVCSPLVELHPSADGEAIECPKCGKRWPWARSA